MQKRSFVTSLALAALVFAASPTASNACYRKINPIVSTEWLAANLNFNLRVIDLRSSEAFNAGHITSSVNSPADGWWTTTDGLLLELPEESYLRAKIGDLGINAGTRVVLANTAENDYDRAQTNRVAWTLIYAGVANVAILDGGYTRWIADGKKLTQNTELPTAIAYHGAFKKSVLATKKNVATQLFSSRIIDARIPADFFGVTTPREFSEKDGHISGAVNLPTPWVFTADGMYKNTDVLAEMARGVIGVPGFKKCIVYCGVGGFASTWWFILSEVLGYPNISLYDGSIQEWTRDPAAPVQKFMW